MTFKDKRWGSYKKWEDRSYVFFDRISRGLDPMIFRPSPKILTEFTLYYSR